MTHDDVTTAPNFEQDDAALSHDAIGAYILGALPESELVVFEAHLRDCPQCQQELRELTQDYLKRVKKSVPDQKTQKGRERTPARAPTK